MNKNLLSIAIILLALAIVFVNLWKPSADKGSTSNAAVENEEESVETEDIPGSDLTQVEEGKPAPDFELTTLDGKTMKLSDLQGKKVILNFWATWCPPCKAEMPHMQNFYEKHKEDDIEVVAVNLTNIDNGRKDIEKFVKDYGLTFSIPLDENGMIGPQYQAFTIPTSYILDTKGVITKKIVGPMDEGIMEDLTKDIE